MLITDFIGYGHDNGITASELEQLTGFSNRAVRDAISNSDEIIINMQDGKGYFKPTVDDLEEVRIWIAQMRHRVKMIEERMSKAQDFVGAAWMCRWMCPCPEDEDNE